MPASPTWSVKKRPEPPRTPVKTSIEPGAGSTIAKAPASTNRPASTRGAGAPPARAPRAGSRRWVLTGAGAVALLAGAAVAVPWLTGPPPSPLEHERPAIEAAMERYRLAYRNRDLEAVTTEFPTLPASLRQTMQRTFKGCLVYEVVFDGVQVQLAAQSEAQAEVALRSTHTCTPQSGGPQTTSAQNETYTLRKTGEAWVIDGVKTSR
jgi:ketosteroid isomerase-like protein